MKTIYSITMLLLLISCKKEFVPAEPQETVTPTTAQARSSAQVAQVGSVLFNPCTNEDMQLSGNLIYQIHDKVAEFHYAGVIGTGLTTGNIYHATGNQLEVFNGNNIVYHYTVMFTARGSKNNLAQSLDLHINLNNEVEQVIFKDAYCK